MANTRTVFDCYYQGGASLEDQSTCPLMLNGEPLLYTETRIITDYTSRHIPWLIIVLAFLASRDLSK